MQKLSLKRLSYLADIYLSKHGSNSKKYNAGLVAGYKAGLRHMLENKIEDNADSLGRLNYDIYENATHDTPGYLLAKKNKVVKIIASGTFFDYIVELRDGSTFGVDAQDITIFKYKK